MRIQFRRKMKYRSEWQCSSYNVRSFHMDEANSGKRMNYKQDIYFVPMISCPLMVVRWTFSFLAKLITHTRLSNWTRR